MCLFVAFSLITFYSYIHVGLIPMPQERAPIRQHGSPLPSHLKPCVGPSGAGARVRESPTGPHRDLLSVALSIHPSKDYPNFKVKELFTFYQQFF